MSDNFYHPEQQGERIRPEPTEQSILEGRIARAKSAADNSPLAREQSERRQFQDTLADRNYEPQVEAQSRITAAADASSEVGGIRDVPVSQINNPEVNSPADFRPGSYEGLRRDLERLQRLKPYIEAGQGEQTAETWDRQQKLGHYTEQGYTRGYLDAYKTYYQTDPIALSPTGDGRYNIINGRHRVYLAQEMGLKTVSARIV
jgi:hypothetical protein